LFIGEAFANKDTIPTNIDRGKFGEFVPPLRSIWSWKVSLLVDTNARCPVRRIESCNQTSIYRIDSIRSFPSAFGLCFWHPLPQVLSFSDPKRSSLAKIHNRRSNNGSDSIPFNF